MKKTRGKGVDLILEIGEFTFYVEVRLNTYKYLYRRKWFHRTVVPHFKKCPHDYYNRHIVLTPLPEIYNTVKDLAKKFCVKIMNFTRLVSYLKGFVTFTKLLDSKLPISKQLTNNNNLTNYNNLIRVTSTLVNSDVNTSFIDSNRLERVRQSKKLEKLKKQKNY